MYGMRSDGLVQSPRKTSKKDMSGEESSKYKESKMKTFITLL